jgi:hypothetical protein
MRKAANTGTEMDIEHISTEISEAEERLGEKRRIFDVNWRSKNIPCNLPMFYLKVCNSARRFP